MVRWFGADSSKSTVLVMMLAVVCLLLCSGTLASATAGAPAVFEFDYLKNSWLKLQFCDSDAKIGVSRPESGACDKAEWVNTLTNHVTYTGGPPEIVKTATPRSSNIKTLVPGTSFQVNCFEKATWTVTISVTNVNKSKITGVTVDDQFGGEFEVMVKSASVGSVSLVRSGRTDKVHLFWNIGVLPAGGRADLVLAVSTDKNPACKQEFTSPGVHLMNSGAVLKYSLNGKQQSRTSGQLQVTAVLPSASKSSASQAQGLTVGTLSVTPLVVKGLSSVAPMASPAVSETQSIPGATFSEDFEPLSSLIQEVPAHDSYPDGFRVPVGAPVRWKLILTVTNTTGVPMSGMVDEHLAAELTADVATATATTGAFSFSVSQSGANDWIRWNVGTLDPGQTVQFQCEIGCRVNSNGERAYSTPTTSGPNYLNWGARLEYYVPDMRIIALDKAPVWVDDSSSLRVSLSATRIDWQIRKPGSFMIDPIEIQVLSNKLVDVSFSGFADVTGLAPEAGRTIPTFYQFSDTMPGATGWVAAEDLAGVHKSTVAAQIGSAVTWKLWPRIDVKQSTKAAEYENTGTITFTVREVNEAVVSQGFTNSTIGKEAGWLEMPRFAGLK